MPTTFANLIKSSSTEEQFLHIFQDAFSRQDQLFLESHRTILAACYHNPELAPKLESITPEVLAQSWLKRYSRGHDGRISGRISKAPGTVADPIINTIIKARLVEMTSEQLDQIKYAHRLSMSAENIQGLLLEEFLAEQLSDYGWHCCWGQSIRHVDFCNVDGQLLQVKNRSNSENSSSSRVRINQPKIELWFRVDAKTGLYQWSYFNRKYHTQRFSEENFVEFVKTIMTKNPHALAVDTESPWRRLSEPSD